jgi:dTDP-glucose 4,6-dehydratase
MKRVLITGGAGFIGSNFIKYMRAAHPGWTLVNIDALTYAGNLENLKEMRDDPDYVFVRGDITDRALLPRLFGEYEFDYVVNFAAETHVDRSIREPEVFLRTNVLGTQCLLDCALASWQTGKDEEGYPVYGTA